MKKAFQTNWEAFKNVLSHKNYLVLRSKPMPAKMSSGNIIAYKRPVCRFPPFALAIMPTTVGPAEQPISPARAISAYMAVPAFGSAMAAVLKVPGQKIPTEKPHNAQPNKPNNGLADNAAIR